MRSVLLLCILLGFSLADKSQKMSYIKSKFFTENADVARQAALNAARAKIAVQKYAQAAKQHKPKHKPLPSENAMSSLTQRNVKPIALVEPPSDWAPLRGWPAQAAGFATRHPHPDIGYYDPLDYAHRRLMRVLADFSGVYGFCFVHRWLEGRPVGGRALQLLLSDGEPDKPFFLCWADGLGQRAAAEGAPASAWATNYNNTAEYTSHFRYLLPILNHSNYMRLSGKVLFAVDIAAGEKAPALDALLRQWDEMAKEAGLGGMYFIRFLRSVNASADLPSVSAHVQIEPQLSWGRMESTDAGVQSDDLKKMRIHAYHKETTWEMIENSYFPNHPNTLYGTFYHWNSVPAASRGAAGGPETPAVAAPVSTGGFDFHIKYMVDKVSAESADPLLFLSSWNNWRDQSALEPSREDGYGALLGLKAALGVHEDRIIVHVSDHGEAPARDRHISDIMAVYMDHLHVVYPFYQLRALATLPDVVLLHVHSAMRGSGAPKWQVLGLMQRFRERGVSTCVTVHDYQYLFPDDPFPPAAELRTRTPQSEDLRNTLALFRLSDKVIFPSDTIRKYYLSHLDKLRKSTAGLIPAERIHTVPHMAAIPLHDYICVPPVRKGSKSALLNVALLSDRLDRDERALFLQLAEKLHKFKSASDVVVTLRYLLFGSASDFSDEMVLSGKDDSPPTQSNVLIVDGPLEDNLSNASSLHRVHVLVSLSSYPEPYSYGTHSSFSSGRPVLFLNSGPVLKMLGAAVGHEKYFPVENVLDDIITELKKAATFAFKQSLRKDTCRSENSGGSRVQPSLWYINHYPTDS